MRLSRALELYYLATPLFAVVDAVFAAPIRVAALEGSNLRWLYYGFAFLCGFLCRRRPTWAGAVGMTESSVNLLLLMLAILLPIWDSLDRVAAGGTPRAPFDEVGVTNFVVSGAVFLMAFYANQSRIRRPESRRFP